MTAARKALVAKIRAYALEHYEDGGWDVIVECWTDEDIVAETGQCRTLNGALKVLRDTVGIYADRQADARNSAF